MFPPPGAMSRWKTTRGSLRGEALSKFVGWEARHTTERCVGGAEWPESVYLVTWDEKKWEWWSDDTKKDGRRETKTKELLQVTRCSTIRILKLRETLGMNLKELSNAVVNGCQPFTSKNTELGVTVDPAPGHPYTNSSTRSHWETGMFGWNAIARYCDRQLTDGPMANKNNITKLTPQN